MNTANLIRNLAADAKPVKRLPHPMVRAAVWIAISLAYVTAITLAYQLSGNGVPLTLDERFLIEELATVVTAVTAAVAAFCCVVPGRDRRIAFLPLLPLAVWLASIGEACANELLRLGSGVFSLRVGWECLPASALIGVLPAITMVVMLRRGAPLFPRSTVVLGALAVAALGNLGLRLFHAGDVTVMMLIWHLGATVTLFALAYWKGPRVLSWRHEIFGRGTVA